MTLTNQPMRTDLNLDHIGEKNLTVLGENILSLLNLSGVDMGRATHYNTKEELEAERSRIHKAVFNIDRTVYGALFCLPGVTDLSMIKATSALLANSRTEAATLLNPEQELELVKHMAGEVQNNRMINLMLGFTSYQKKNVKGEIIATGLRINNARTRKFVFATLFNSPTLDWWTVKYKKKLVTILTHFWGQKITGVLRKILVTKQRRSAADKQFLTKYIIGFLDTQETKRVQSVLECIAFLLGRREGFKLPLLVAFEAAKSDIMAGIKLPMEVLEGIAVKYHPGITKGDILKLTEKSGSMTNKQRKNVQATAKKAGVKVKFNPYTMPMVDLYIYAFEMGMSKQIQAALWEKAKKVASTLPFKYDHIGILVDDSFSATGDKTQKLRPMATALATRDMLAACSNDIFSFATASGRKTEPCNLLHPSGDSALAEGLVDLLEKDPNAVFVISDGYENAPAGRFAEVLELASKIGCHTPVYHLNPVASTDSRKGVRQLSPQVPVMPVNRPEAMGLALFKAMLETEPEKGIIGIVGSALSIVQSTSVSRLRKLETLRARKGGK